MIHSASRAISLLVVLGSLWAAGPDPTIRWYVMLGVAPSLVLIWFPRQVDEYTFGLWTKGYRIDSHTPAVLIAVVGWLLLLVSASFVLTPGLIARIFGAV